MTPFSLFGNLRMRKFMNTSVRDFYAFENVYHYISLMNGGVYHLFWSHCNGEILDAMARQIKSKNVFTKKIVSVLEAS